MYEFEAIGTHWWLERLDGGTFTDDIRESLERYTAEFDQRYSRFRDDSLVAELARTGKLSNPPKEMLDMLDYARKMFDVTDGAFTPSVGKDLEALGYGSSTSSAKTYKATNSPKSLKRLNLFSSERAQGGKVLGKKIGVASLRSFDEIVRWDEHTVIAPQGRMLDFGGFGKGWLIDEYVKILRDHGATQFIVNGGGDLYVQSETPVEFALEDPYDATKMIGSIKIQRGALAASSTIKRSWENDAGKQHHIIDPKTGKPSESGVVASFVIAETALIADVLATVLIIRPELESAMREKYSISSKLIARI